MAKAVARRWAVTLLDASQTLGLVDVDVHWLETDMTAFTGHKYFLGPVGTGGLYVLPDVELEPILVARAFGATCGTCPQRCRDGSRQARPTS